MHVSAASTSALQLHERQRAFAAAILDPDVPVPPGLIGPDGASSTTRFAVYRNNVVVGLIDALRAAFPATQRLVGDEFFSAMARIYVAHEPPKSPVMLRYGAGFADFVGRFEPAQCVPYLHDVARLERAWVEAYHASEAQPIGLEELCSLESEALPHLRLRLHPSVRVIQSSFPLVTLWQMNVKDGTPAPVDIERGGEDALVSRPLAEVEVRRLAAGAAVFIQALIDKKSVDDAATLAMFGRPDFDLTAVLQGLFEMGLIEASVTRESNECDATASMA